MVATATRHCQKFPYKLNEAMTQNRQSAASLRSSPRSKRRTDALIKKKNLKCIWLIKCVWQLRPSKEIKLDEALRDSCEDSSGLRFGLWAWHVWVSLQTGTFTVQITFQYKQPRFSPTEVWELWRLRRWFTRAVCVCFCVYVVEDYGSTGWPLGGVGG